MNKHTRGNMLPDRSSNIIMLLEIVPLLREIDCAARGSKLQANIEQQWLVPLAAKTINGQISERIMYWKQLFATDLDAVYRAHNNVLYGHWISDANLSAACSIAQRLWELARETADA